MAQVIQLHSYVDCYPFGQEKQTPFTYVEMTKIMNSTQQQSMYQKNLKIFKSLQSQLIIPMDSFLKQQNKLLIYYHYEPLSIKTYITQILNKKHDQTQRDNFINKIINNINLSIENLIELLSNLNIEAILAIDNVAINPQTNQIKFFIEPDFEIVSNDSKTSVFQYYHTERKKLQLQIQEFLQELYSSLSLKPTQTKKANFIIQGNKLLFINDSETNRHSCVTTILPFTETLKSKQKNTTLSSDNNSQNNSKNSITSHENSKHKFDIKNILDEKKLQKNQILNMLEISNKKQENNTKQEKDKRQVKNYFQNNDNFNKDASFYPQEFIKDDSIAQFQGYEDQLEKELEDLKKKKAIEEQNKKHSHQSESTSPSGADLSEQKMIKFPGFVEMPTQIKQEQIETLKLKSLNNNSRELNSSNNQQNDVSTERKQKKKYKVTITTSHQVDVEQGQNINLKEIEKQLIDDIKKGRLQAIETNINPSTYKNTKNPIQKQQIHHHSSIPHIIRGRQTHNPSSLHQIYPTHENFQQRNASLNSFGSNMSSSMDQKSNDEKIFTKNNQFLIEKAHQIQSGKQIRSDSSGASTLVKHGHDIKKILQKIKNNSQNHNNPLNTNVSEHLISSSKEIEKVQNQNVQNLRNRQIKQKKIFSQQTTQAQGLQYGKQSKILDQKKQSQQSDKQYHEKIQKAKMKAEQIMKLVKQRKGN